MLFKHVVPQSPDARLTWAFVVGGFIRMNKVKAQEQIQKIEICPNILHVDADADAGANAGVLAIVLH